MNSRAHHDAFSRDALSRRSSLRRVDPTPPPRRPGCTPTDHHAPLELAAVDIRWAVYVSSRMHAFGRSLRGAERTAGFDAGRDG